MQLLRMKSGDCQPAVCCKPGCSEPVVRYTMYDEGNRDAICMWYGFHFVCEQRFPHSYWYGQHHCIGRRMVYQLPFIRILCEASLRWTGVPVQVCVCISHAMRLPLSINQVMKNPIMLLPVYTGCSQPLSHSACTHTDIHTYIQHASFCQTNCILQVCSLLDIRTCIQGPCNMHVAPPYGGATMYVAENSLGDQKAATCPASEEPLASLPTILKTYSCTPP